MSQPFNRACKVPAPGDPDRELGEFWVASPWDISTKHNLSAYERNRMFWNVAGGNFLDISTLTGTDSDGDGRSSVAADFDGDGRLDLAVRQSGGGPFLLFKNQFPQRHGLAVTLRGVKSQRQGIGARLTAVAGGRRIVREMNLINSYYSRTPAVVHFGLGDATRIDRLEIEWPSGETQELTDLDGDRHVVIQEGASNVDTVQRGQTIAP